MAGGRLNDRITIPRKVPGNTPGGNSVVGWADLELTAGTPLTLWADMNEDPGIEALVAGRNEATRRATVQLRVSPAAREITAADRIVARGAVWKIRSAPAQAPERADLLVLLCEEWIRPPN